MDHSVWSLMACFRAKNRRHNLVQTRMEWRRFLRYNFGAKVESSYPITHLSEGGNSNFAPKLYAEICAPANLPSWFEQHVICWAIFPSETSNGAPNAMVLGGQLSIQNPHHCICQGVTQIPYYYIPIQVPQKVFAVFCSSLTTGPIWMEFGTATFVHSFSAIEKCNEVKFCTAKIGEKGHKLNFCKW